MSRLTNLLLEYSLFLNQKTKKMDYTKIIDTEYNDEPKVVALVAPRLTFTGGPANTIQLSVEQDGQDAYVDLWLSEAILLKISKPSLVSVGV